jgi:hypothetical protein
MLRLKKIKNLKRSQKHGCILGAVIGNGVRSKNQNAGVFGVMRVVCKIHCLHGGVNIIGLLAKTNHCNGTLADKLI